MTWQSGGGGGIPGVTSDGLIPGGEVIAGALTAGDATAADVPTFHRIYGDVILHSAPGTDVDGDDVLDISHIVNLSADSSANALRMSRIGSLNGHDCSQAIFFVQDVTASTGPLAQFVSNAVAQLQVDNDGVRVHGKLKTGASVTHTLGAYSGKSVPVYDEAGTLLGYMPLYA